MKIIVIIILIKMKKLVEVIKEAYQEVVGIELEEELEKIKKIII